MGLSASQARVFLLTSKNNHYELQAQLIEDQRLLLAQEEERIAEEYSEKTSNSIYVVSTYSTDEHGNNVTAQETLTLSSLVRSNTGKKFVITDTSGRYIGYARYDEDDQKVKFSDNTNYSGKDTKEVTSDPDEIAHPMMHRYVSGDNTWAFQEDLAAGRIQLYEFNLDMAVGNSEGKINNTSCYFHKKLQGEDATDGGWVRKTFEQLDTVKPRYYTEDDAAAQAEYQVAMKRVNVLDTKLENKLNKIESLKKAVETELESAKNLIKTNIERTFKYFG